MHYIIVGSGGQLDWQRLVYMRGPSNEKRDGRPMLV